MEEFNKFDRPLSAAEANARAKRNTALAIILVAFMGLVFAITIVRLKEGVVRDQDWSAETEGWQRDEAVVEAGEGPVPGLEAPAEAEPVADGAAEETATETEVTDE